MKKILVPTDFSAIANAAATYASELASVAQAEIDLLHVVNLGGGDGRQLKNWEELQAQVVRAAEEKGKALVQKIGKLATARYATVSGFPIEKVVKGHAKKIKADLIVMGTMGASGLKKVMMGTNAASVINTVSTPVLAIPPGAHFNGIRHILYATDMAHLDSEITKVANIARDFGAFITVAYVNEEADLQRNRHELERILTRMAKYPNIAFTAVRGRDVKMQLQKLVSSLRPDVIAMFTHKLAFLEKVFKQSVTRDVLFSTKIPLLSFNRSK